MYTHEQEERDVAEVEQAGEADDDIETECEQRVRPRTARSVKSGKKLAGVLGEPEVRNTRTNERSRAQCL